MKEFVLVMASVYGALSVVFGAFGAHLLKKYLQAEQLQSFETAVRYQIYHAIVLLFAGFAFSFQNPLESCVTWAFIVGIFLFSFSIYVLVLSGANGKKWRWLGPVTPLGGLLLVAGWCGLLMVFLKK